MTPADLRLLLSGLLLVASLAAFGWLDGLTLPLPRLLLPLAAFGCYVSGGLLAARSSVRHQLGDSSLPQAPSSHLPAPASVTLAAIWAIAILARVALLPLAPELSDDVYRYLWDGHVLTQGVNPYAHAPDAEALAALRTPWHGEINHPEVPTIYPPLAQFLFGAVAWLAPAGAGILASKLLWLMFDLASGVILHRIAVVTGRNPAPVLVWYLWSPLLIVETAWSGHFEAVGLCLMALAMLVDVRAGGTRLQAGAPSHVPAGVADRRRQCARALGVGSLLAAATMVKFAPAAALPAMVRRHGVRVGIAFAAVCALLYLPFVGIGLEALTEGLRTYARHWSANEGAFNLILAAAGGPVTARVAVAALVLGVVAWTCWRTPDGALESALLWTIGAGLLLAPTIHPWYVLWALPMAALRGNQAFLLLGGLAFVGYWGLDAYRTTGVWLQPAWAPWVMWLPVWILIAGLGLAGVVRRRSRRAAVNSGAGPPRSTVWRSPRRQ